MEEKIIVTTPETIEKIVLKALYKYNTEQANKRSETKLLTINKVAKILGVSHTTVKNLTENETIKTTADNKITEKELNRYLEN